MAGQLRPIVVDASTCHTPEVQVEEVEVLPPSLPLAIVDRVILVGERVLESGEAHLLGNHDAAELGDVPLIFVVMSEEYVGGSAVALDLHLVGIDGVDAHFIGELAESGRGGLGTRVGLVELEVEPIRQVDAHWYELLRVDLGKSLPLSLHPLPDAKHCIVPLREAGSGRYCPEVDGEGHV